MISGALLALGGPHCGRSYHTGDGHMQTEGHGTVRAVGEPDAGVQGDDLGAPHQDDVHNDWQALVVGWRVHLVAVLAHHAHSYIL